jgi:hypothetical protein
MGLFDGRSTPEHDDPMKNTLTNIAKVVAGVVAAVFGFALATQLGANFMIPALGAAIVWVVAWKTAAPGFRPMIPAFAVQAGHGLWMLFGLVYLQRLDVTIIDLLILAGGLGWLWLRPGWPSVVFLTVFQLVALGVNLYFFEAVPEGSLEERALAVHILLRIVAVALLIRGIRLLRQNSSTDPLPA